MTKSCEKWVVLTGGAKRMGAAIAQALVAAGYGIILHYNKSQVDALRLCDEIQEMGGFCAPIQSDFSDETSVKSFIERAFDDSKFIFGIVNNACYFENDHISSTTFSSLHSHFQINVFAPVMISQAFAKSLGLGEKGVIVNMLDAKLFAPNPDYLSYTLSKSAMASFTQLAAQEFSGQIRVVGIAPSLTLTSPEFQAQHFEQSQTLNLNQAPLKPDMIANGVLFALENEALNGSVLRLDAGAALLAPVRDFPFLTEQELKTYANILPPKSYSS